MTHHKLEKIVAFDNHMLKAKFVNGAVKYYDINKLFALDPQPVVNGKPMFAPLHDPKLFNSVYVDYNGVCAAWNTEIDIDADTIWYDGTPAGVGDGWTKEDDTRCNEPPLDTYYGTLRAPNLNNSEIAFFNEITIQIFPTDDKKVIPYIVAHYENDTAYIEIATGEVIKGEFPPTGVEIVNEWLEQNLSSIQRIWDTEKLVALPKC